MKIPARKCISLMLSCLMLCLSIAGCTSLSDKVMAKIDDVMNPSEETAYKSTWENPNWGREMNPFFLNGDAEYWEVEDLDPLRRGMVDSFVDDFFTGCSRESCLYYWIEGVRADSEYICIYVTIYVEGFDEDEPYSYSMASIIKTRRDPPTTDYVGVSSSRDRSWEEVSREYYPGEIYDNCSPVPDENHDVHVSVAK